MRDSNKRSKWKWGVVLAVKIYACLCTLLVTAVFGLVLWEMALTQTPPGEDLRHQGAVGEGEQKRLDLTGIGLSYELSKSPHTSAGLFESHAAIGATSSTRPAQDSAANGSLPARSETNQTSSAAGLSH